MEKLRTFPRRRYSSRTPIQPLPNLSAHLGGKVNVYVKRDDLLGLDHDLIGGGNKVRKLEFSIAHALQLGADTIVTCGAVQSNHCRLTLAACRREGLKCVLILEERVPGSYDRDASGNNYLFHLLGVERIVAVPAGEHLRAMAKAKEELERAGRCVHVIPGGASDDVGSLGYVACAQELVAQSFEEDLPPFAAVIVPSGSGGTHSGIVTGLTSMGSGTKVIGISVRKPASEQKAHIESLAESLSAKLSVPAPPAGAVAIRDEFVGRGYSYPTDAMAEAISLFAQLEGILLDPVYSGKAAAGLIGLIRSSEFPEGSSVLFLHTGGSPALFQYQPLPAPYERSFAANETPSFNDV